MVQFVPISRERHRGKKWRRPDGYGFAAGNVLVPIGGAEVFRAALAMPIAFVEQSGGYQLMAMLSFTPGRNMFVGPDGRWLGSYIPAWYRSYPFRLLAREGTDEPVLCIDEDNKLVVEGADAGEEFFDADGNPSQSLKPVLGLLRDIEHDRKKTQLAVSALSEAQTIQPWSIKLKTAQAEQAISGLNRIDEARLNALEDDIFLKLRKASALPVAYGQMLSIGQIGLFEYLAKFHTKLVEAQSTRSAISKLPESIDSLFGMTEDDTVQFR